jgi:hypothetical protein
MRAPRYRLDDVSDIGSLVDTLISASGPSAKSFAAGSEGFTTDLSQLVPAGCRIRLSRSQKAWRSYTTMLYKEKSPALATTVGDVMQPCHVPLAGSTCRGARHRSDSEWAHWWGGPPVRSPVRSRPPGRLFFWREIRRCRRTALVSRSTGGRFRTFMRQNSPFS